MAAGRRRGRFELRRPMFYAYFPSSRDGSKLKLLQLKITGQNFGASTPGIRGPRIKGDAKGTGLRSATPSKPRIQSHFPLEKINPAPAGAAPDPARAPGTKQ